MSFTIRTTLLDITDPEQDAKHIQTAAKVIQNGGLVVFPTETVYGIGADGLRQDAVAKIFAAKGRPQDNPLILHIYSLSDLYKLAQNVPESAYKLATRFWPGPLTMVLPKRDIVPEAVSAGLSTVAVRMPSHPAARELIRVSGVPIAAPSANLSGSPSPTTARHCVDDLDGRVDIILDGGPCDVGLESTVITLAEDIPRLLRPGSVTLEELREELGHIEVDPAVQEKADASKPAASPGMKYRHYAPKAEVILLHGSSGQFASYLQKHQAAGIYALCFDEECANLPVPSVGYGGRNHPAAQARRLFAALRELDDKAATRVFAHAPSRKGIELAIYNRLLRAAAFREIYL